MTLTIAAYFHRLDPFAIQISQDAGLRWYGLSYLTGFFLAYLIVRTMARRGISPLPAERVADFVFAVAIGTVVGGRLGYCLFYARDRFTDFDETTILGITMPFWGVLKLWDGGMASHGGIIGIAVACIIFARYTKTPTLHLFDLCSLTGGLGVFFGRLANFVNGELVGRPCDPRFSLAVRFPQDMTDWNREQLQELGPVIDAIGPENLGASAQQWDGWLNQYTTDQTIFARVHETIDRLIAITHQRTPLGERAVELLTPMIETRHPSQLYQAFGEGLAMFVVLMLIWLVPRKPGVIGAACLMLYAGFRILGEQFRMPDNHIAHHEFAQYGVTRGQLLSFAMFSVGLVLMILWVRRPVPKLGGWLKSKRGD